MENSIRISSPIDENIECSDAYPQCSRTYIQANMRCRWIQRPPYHNSHIEYMCNSQSIPLIIIMIQWNCVRIIGTLRQQIVKFQCNLLEFYFNYGFSHFSFFISYFVFDLNIWYCLQFTIIYFSLFSAYNSECKNVRRKIWAKFNLKCEMRHLLWLLFCACECSNRIRNSNSNANG